MPARRNGRRGLIVVIHSRVALSALAAALLSGHAAAAPAEAPAADAAASGLADIVVTAQRRQQSAQDVGIALSVITGETLARRGVNDIVSLQYQSPSFEITPAFGGGQPQFRLRGVGFEDYATNNTPTVGIYVDEVAFPVPVTTQGVLFDLARVEVLRGPQGTLYGRNTTGGAVNFITNKPTDELSAGGTVEYGRFGLFDVEAFVSGPITATLKARIAATTEQGGGFQRNRDTDEQLGDADKLFGRGLLEWTPSAGVDVTLNVHGGRDRSENTGLYLFDDFTTKNYPPAGAVNFVPGPTIPADGHRATGWGYSAGYAALTGADQDDKPHRRNTSYGTSLNAQFTLAPTIKLTSITAYDHLRRLEYDDWDASPSHELDTFWGSKVGVFSQELRLSSLGTDKFTWVAGAYYSHQTLTETFITDFTDSLGFFTDTSYRQKANSISGFGQAEYKVTDQLTLIAGGRYEHEKRALRDFSTQIIIPPTVDFPTFGDGNRDQKLNKWSGKVGLEYQVDRRVLLYANASKGVKSGGFTVYNSPNAGQIDAFKPETLYAYEVGFKSDPARQLRFNGSAFYYDYRDQQVLGAIIDPDVGAIGRITNAPKSKIYGGEIELDFAPTSRLRITQSLGYKKGEYVRYSDVDLTSVAKDPATGLYAASFIDFKGRQLPFANWSYQGSGSYTLPIGDYQLVAEGNYSYRDTTPNFLGPAFTVGRFWLANANLTFSPQNGNWSVGVYGRNILGEKYDLTRNYFLPNAKIAAPGRPASYGVRLGFNF